MQDDIRRMKLALERVNTRRSQLNEKLSDINLQLDNADREHKRVVVKKQVRSVVITTSQNAASSSLMSTC